MEKIKYKKETAFVNRQEEITYLKEYLQECPENILFLYGPKSSGKTTLLYKLLDQIGNEEKYEIKNLNLREIWIGNYKDFIRTFFNVVENIDKKSKNKYEISAGIFKINRETEQKLLKINADPFKVMKQELIELNQKGIQPVIIIDELQKLREIYINGQRQLINELFNFFVSITKESHLAHIVISSSDGYFIERIYEDSRLRKTSKFCKVDYLTKEDVKEWLSNLEKYSKIMELVLTEEQKKEIWGFLGGSGWEIQSLLSDIMFGGFETAIARNRKERESEVINCINKDFERKKILTLFSKNRKLTKEEIFNLSKLEFETLNTMLSQLVSENILFFDPVKAIFTPQSRSVEYGINRYFSSKR